jgi:3',5'-cyclic AMP phosphodiesterase CpdA
MPMRIAATADIHFVPQNQSVLHDQLQHVRDQADVLVLAGDLTNYGQPGEMEPLLNLLRRTAADADVRRNQSAGRQRL